MIQLLLCFQTVQQFFKRRDKRQTAVAGFRLCPILLNNLAFAVYGRLRDGIPDGDRFPFEVDRVPLQANRFTSAQSVKCAEDNAKLDGVAFDDLKKPRYANLRGIGSDFIGDANGSDKHYSFGIPAAVWSDTLNLFESAIDLLSYGTMQKLDGKDWRSENLLSLAGVYKPKAKIEESSLPAALVQYLADYPHIRKVVLRLDNDPAGRIAAATIQALLTKRYAVAAEIRPPAQGKDYNDGLCMRLGLPITKRKELHGIGNNLNQIAAKAHTLNALDVQRYDENCRKLDDAVKTITVAVILPRPMK